MIINPDNEIQLFGLKWKPQYDNILRGTSKILIDNLGKVIAEEKVILDEYTLWKISIQKNWVIKKWRFYRWDKLKKEDFFYDDLWNVTKIWDHILYLAVVEDNWSKKMSLLELWKEIAINEFVYDDVQNIQEFWEKLVYVAVIKQDSIKYCLLEIGQHPQEEDFVINWIDQVKEVWGEIYYKAMIEIGDKYKWAWLKQGEKISHQKDFIATWITDIEEIWGRYFYKAKVEKKWTNKRIRVELWKKITRKTLKIASESLWPLLEDEQWKIFIEKLWWNKKKKKYYL